MEYYGNNHLIHLAQFSVEDVLPYRNPKKGSVRGYEVSGKIYSVKMASHRYQIFAKSTICACCGLVGDTMVLDISHYDFERNGRPHFNLYAKWDGCLVLMTKDHIIPRSKGGKNEIGNYQTMCCLCNSAKSDHDVTIEELQSFETVAARIKEIKEEQLIIS